MSAVWPGVVVEEKAIQVHIPAARKALAEEAPRLVTVHGKGYRFQPASPDLETESESTLSGRRTIGPRTWVLILIPVLLEVYRLQSRDQDEREQAPTITRARAAARRALELNPRYGFAYAVRGGAEPEWNWDGRLEYLRVAEQLTPNDADVFTGQQAAIGDDSGASFDAVLWSEATGLAVLPGLGGLFRGARGINDVGIAVGGEYDGDVTDTGLWWGADRSVHTLGFLPGFTTSAPNAVNNGGLVVGWSADTAIVVASPTASAGARRCGPWMAAWPT